ncbi:MAG: Zn-ribbon domain-containing OB-fold protein [Pseudorhodoplanes sp.]
MDQASQKYEKPLPNMDPEDKPFWESVKEHRMKVQRCAECGSWCFQPKPFCPKCLSDKLEWTPVKGRGKVYASTTIHHAFMPYWKGDVPFNLSIIELDEGVHMVSNVIGVPPQDVKIGMPVEVVYDDVTEEITLHKFRPVAKG